MSSIEGGSFESGFAAGAISSLVSSGISALGETGAIGTNADGSTFAEQNKFGKSSWFKATMITSAGLSGGLSSSIAGGSFWSGARQGVIVATMNHLAHMGFDKSGENFENEDDIDPPTKKGKTSNSKNKTVTDVVVNDIGNTAMNTGGTMYGTAEMTLKNSAFRSSLSKGLSNFSGVKASIFNKAFRQTGRVLGGLGKATGAIGAGATLVGAGSQVYNGTDNTAMWVDTTISTLLFIGTVVPSPLTPFCAAGSLIYGATRLTAGNTIDSSINNNFGYR